MIIGHGYKIIDNKAYLVLYLDNLYELGNDINSIKDNKSFKDEIKKYIKAHRLNISNDKILLCIGGLIIGGLLIIGNPVMENDYKLTYVDSSIIIENKEIVKEEIIDDLIQEEIKEEIIIDKPDINIEKPSIEENNKPLNNNTSNNIVNKPNNNINTNKPIEENKEIIIKPEEENIKVTVYRSNGSVITLDLEEYVIGVVGAEMPASFSIEALKAQAIISRTYALKRIESGLTLTDTVSTQRYKDINELKKDWGSSFDKYYNKVKEAVLSTKDLKLYYQDKLIDAVYHSTSNGKTEDSINVWGNDIPYLKSVVSKWDIDASSYLRTTEKNLKNVLNLLGINSVDEFTILSRNESGRVNEIKINDNIYSGIEFRTLLGLRSTDFDIEVNENNISITTRGYGHGVGLSQYGANGMAKEGYKYKDILKHYYTGIDIK